MKTKDIVWLTVFSIAMGLLEAAVVIYIREIYYPDGFSFPLIMISNRIAFTELLREVATVVMLSGMAYFTGKKFIIRFGSFLYAFAIWDIFYYVFLWLILDWPESLLTWDVLFLIPIMWVGPVIAPVIISLTMILYAFVFWNTGTKQEGIKISKVEWLLMISGSLILILSFTLDLIKYLYNTYSFEEIKNFSNENMVNLTTHYVPDYFNWTLFGAGEVILIISIGLFYRRIKKNLL